MDGETPPVLCQRACLGVYYAGRVGKFALLVALVVVGAVAPSRRFKQSIDSISRLC